MTNSTRFLDLYAALERHLRKLARADRHLTFYALVDSAAERSPVIRLRKDDLKEYGDLRNAIVHERSDGHAIAEPHERVVRDMQALVTLVLQPPSVLPAFQKSVHTVSRSDSIRSILRYFSPKNFSQVPVTSDGRLVGLLTTNTVARWLASEATTGIVDMDDHTVADALRHTEHDGNWRLASKGTSLVDVADYFDSAEEAGKRLDAVLITQNGKPTETLLGIITIHDMPKLLRIMVGQARRRGAA